MGPSRHLAPFLQGVLAHSSTSYWHKCPVKPAAGEGMAIRRQGHNDTTAKSWLAKVGGRGAPGRAPRECFGQGWANGKRPYPCLALFQSPTLGS